MRACLKVPNTLFGACIPAYYNVQGAEFVHLKLCDHTMAHQPKHACSEYVADGSVTSVTTCCMTHRWRENRFRAGGRVSQPCSCQRHRSRYSEGKVWKCEGWGRKPGGARWYSEVRSRQMHLKWKGTHTMTDTSRLDRKKSVPNTVATCTHMQDSNVRPEGGV